MNPKLVNHLILSVSSKIAAGKNLPKLVNHFFSIEKASIRKQKNEELPLFLFPKLVNLAGSVVQ